MRLHAVAFSLKKSDTLVQRQRLLERHTSVRLFTVSVGHAAPECGAPKRYNGFGVYRLFFGG